MHKQSLVRMFLAVHEYLEKESVSVCVREGYGLKLGGCSSDVTGGLF